MHFDGPDFDDLKGISEHYKFSLSSAELDVMHSTLEPVLEDFRQLQSLYDEMFTRPLSTAKGYSPPLKENRHGAWNWKVTLEGQSGGPLFGKTVAIKDNVAVAGVPLTNGTDLLKDFIPNRHASVVQRILDSGGTILGKARCENLCFSGGSHTSDSGIVHNPYDAERSAGGSSSGSAVLVATAEVDMAIGGDQGGSIRIPSSWCGIYGLKPTWGLVPYTGAFPIEPTLDHLGPMARTVEDVALMLEAISGPDGSDPRQSLPAGLSFKYQDALDLPIEGLRVGIVEEGFAWPQSESDVDATIRSQANTLQSLGATVLPISIPLHRKAMAIWNGIGLEGTLRTMVHGNAYGSGWKGLYDPDLMEFWGESWRAMPDALPYTVKRLMLIAEFLHKKTHGRYYGMAQNLSSVLSAAYDKALEQFDILVMPTTPMVAQPLPAPNAPLEERFRRSFEMLSNTVACDVTGHPAMSIPIGLVRGLPVGLMAVSQKFNERTLLRFARAIEKNYFRPVVPA